MKDWLGLCALCALLAALFTHVFDSIVNGFYFFAVGGFLVFPVGIINGLMVWSGV